MLSFVAGFVEVEKKMRCGFDSVLQVLINYL